MTEQHIPHFHTAGVGAGPANLSVAALFEAVAPDRIVLFEAQACPAWHGGLLFPGVRMQTGWLKDLVSLVEPAHRVSFLNYLVRTHRVFTFLSAQYAEIPRLEYVRYLEWSAQQLSDVHFGMRVDCISYADGFALYSDGKLLTTSDHLILGIGSMPRMPPGLAGLDGRSGWWAAAKPAPNVSWNCAARASRTSAGSAAAPGLPRSTTRLRPTRCTGPRMACS